MGAFNEQTAGLIDTQVQYAKAIELSQSKIPVTEKQYAAMGAAVSDLSAKLGEGKDAATARFERLVDAIKMASPEALVPFGIQLKTTGDKFKDQIILLQELEKGYSGVTAEVQTLGQQYDVLANQAGTIADFYIAAQVSKWEKFAVTIASNGQALSEWEQQLHDTNGVIAEWDMSFAGFTNRAVTNIGRLSTELRENWGILGAWFDPGGFFQEAGEKAVAERQRLINNIMINEKMKSMGGAAGSIRVNASGLVKASKKMKLGRGGGGGSNIIAEGSEAHRAAMAEIEAFNRSAAQIQEAMRITMGGGLDIRTDLGSVSGQTDPAGRGAGGALAEAQGASRQKAFEAQMERDKENQLIQEQQARSHAQILLGIEKDMLDKKEKMYEQDAAARVKANEAAVATVGQTFSNLASTIEGSSEASFNASKAFAVAAATVEGGLAIVAGIRSVMQTVPFPAAIPVAIGYAGSIAALTGKQIADILSTSYGQGKKPTAASSAVSAGSAGRASVDRGNQYQFNLSIAGQTMLNVMLDENESAQMNNNRAFATSSGFDGTRITAGSNSGAVLRR
jgi:hypothetical protein